MCLNSSRLLKSLWTPGIGIQNHLSGQLPWIRSWRNCNGAGKPSKTSSQDAPCRVHEKGGENNSSRLGDTTLAAKGFWVTYPRYRGAWDSDGEFLAKSHHEDILDVLDELPKELKEIAFGQRFRLAPDQVFVIGGSFGGAAAILSSLDRRVTRIVANLQPRSLRVNTSSIRIPRSCVPKRGTAHEQVYEKVASKVARNSKLRIPKCGQPLLAGVAVTTHEKPPRRGVLQHRRGRFC
jgi:hypothetical protein